MIVRRLLGTALHNANVKPGPLLRQPAAVSHGLLPAISIPLIPRRNPFRRPMTAFLRNFQTFEPQSIISVSPILFRAPLRKDVMHRVVVWHRASLRAGTASSKARGEVRGSTRKIRPQKGTGRARVGSSRAPHRRGGGRCFGPKPRDHYFSLPPKIRALGLRSALSAKFSEGRLTFVDEASLALPTHKTLVLAKILQAVPVAAKKILLLDTEPVGSNLRLASQSLADRFKSLDVTKDKVNAYHILDCSYVVITRRAQAHLSAWLSKGV